MKPLDQDPCHRWDKLGLFALGGIALAVLGAMVIGPLAAETLPQNVDVLYGTIAAGLLLFLRDIVNAIRAGWEEVTRGKTNEQLAGSSPSPPPPPRSAVEAAGRVADAADEEAASIGARKGDKS